MPLNIALSIWHIEMQRMSLLAWSADMFGMEVANWQILFKVLSAHIAVRGLNL